MTASHSPATAATSPFGGPAVLVQSVPAAAIAAMYRRKCDVDVTPFLGGQPTLDLHECPRTGYRFWRPEAVAGNEAFYHLLSNAWPDYYRSTRWEYARARAALRGAGRVVEVGCGRGYFLASLEGEVAHALGLELNTQAIGAKVTRFPVESVDLGQLASRGERFDAVCAFQVLEHLTDPAAFLRSAVQCLAPGGVLVLSTPDAEYQPLRDQSDAFDFPPHHMGRFDKPVFRRVAGILGLDVVALVSQPRIPAFEEASEATRRRFAFKVARGTARALYTFAYRICAEPGPNLLAVLRRR